MPRPQQINKILSHSLGFAEVQMKFREFRVKSSGLRVQSSEAKVMGVFCEIH